MSIECADGRNGETNRISRYTLHLGFRVFLYGGLLLAGQLPAGTQQDHSQKAAPGQTPPGNAESLDTARKKQIADDSARLLQLATDLKSEVDKTTKDTLSIGVIRKADEIEKLAHAVKVQMQPAAGYN